ncbi:MAG: MaoC family dehydratase [Acidimicrobiia bacterium]
MSRPSRHRSLVLTADLLRLYSRRGNYHSDPDAAADIGYTRLVAQGMQVAGPAYGLLLDEWGDDFLAHGAIDLKFVGMVTDGETVEATVVPSETDEAEIVVTVADRTAVVGRAVRRTRSA